MKNCKLSRYAIRIPLHFMFMKRLTTHCHMVLLAFRCTSWYNEVVKQDKGTEYMIKRGKKWPVAVAFMVIAAIFAGVLYGHYEKKKNSHPYEEFIVVDVFDSQANFQGIQSGWFAKVVKDKYNMELNIIAPNVAGGGDTLFEMRSAAGNLGDLIITGSDNGKLEQLVTAGLILDMSPYLKDKRIMRFERAIRELNDPVSESGIYAIPSELSGSSPLDPSESTEPTFGPYLRWDLYAELGYPKLETLEDLLPVLKEMQKLNPYGDTGNPTYAFSFFKDWDGNLMNNAKQPACFYGYDENGFVLANAEGTDFQSIIDTNSLYMRSLKFYFEANRMGLVDPDSMTQNYDSVFQKYQNGDILFCFWPWLSQSAYNTLSNKEEGKGFMLAPIEDMRIYSYGCRSMGNSQMTISIGSNAKDPERLADFIDWLYSPEGIQMNSAQMSGGSAGPEGLTWEMTENGPALTEFGVQALLNGDISVPEEWGGGLWSDGISTLNYKPVVLSDKDENGYPYAYQLWESVLEMNRTKLDKSWQDYMKEDSTMAYLKKHDMLVVAPGCSYQTPVEDSEISTLRSQCKNIIVEYSWKMIFAQDEETFYALQKDMQERVKSLGYDRVLEQDMKNAKEKAEVQQKIVERYQ